jgi:hypothetical protein
MNKRDDVPWKNDYPLERYVLGLLGRIGYRGRRAARIAQDQMFPHVRTISDAIPTLDTFISRMEKGGRYTDEMKNIQAANYGIDQSANRMLILHLPKFAHLNILNYGIVSSGTSAHETTKVNKARQKVKALKSKRAGFKQVVAS